MNPKAQEVVRFLTAFATMLDDNGLQYSGTIRQIAQLIPNIADGDHDPGGCLHCHGEVDRKPRGRPPVYCSTRCRRAAWRERKRDEMVY